MSTQHPFQPPPNKRAINVALALSTAQNAIGFALQHGSDLLPEAEAAELKAAAAECGYLSEYITDQEVD